MYLTREFFNFCGPLSKPGAQCFTRARSSDKQHTTERLPYSQKFSPSPAIFVLYYFLRDKIFVNVVKGPHICYAIFNTGDKKNSWIKFSPMRINGEIGENFLLAKVSSCTILIHGLAYMVFSWDFWNSSQWSLKIKQRERQRSLKYVVEGYQQLNICTNPSTQHIHVFLPIWVVSIEEVCMAQVSFIKNVAQPPDGIKWEHTKINRVPLIASF